MSLIQTRIPRLYGYPDPSEIVETALWRRDTSGNLVPTGITTYAAGQAWERNGDGNLVARSGYIVFDLHWERDGDGNLVPTGV